ncbi:Homogentisate 1,2-dioxygenase [Exidia glandulosa HHB12029]|uniref:homogentisate 1,2-dioxygenase n=1 Tax=Exidia glandulosa HHB12029 TaxID=1314781 RepID=A0A165F323_EXIGL|nr:Homogentisate 1,2-dioxygenase [Exidia glandulosa HHB12029]
MFSLSARTVSVSRRAFTGYSALARRTVVSYTAPQGFSTTPTDKDPYKYQVGFGNRFASEAIPGTLPVAQNSPQKCKYDLYAEQMTGTAFVAPRAQNQNAWLYRIRPAVAHQGFTKLADNPDLESNFSPLNPRVRVSPTQLAWRPFDVPSEPVEFHASIKTLTGNGDPTSREGLAIHQYACTKSMGNTAFVNNDGDMMIMPVEGRLDIQTEMGRLMVRPGEIFVVQRGIRFKVLLPDGIGRGYVNEIFGSHFELPELGPLGANGLANARDFEFPVASFDVDQSAWEIIYKVCGQYFLCKQEHTPFDVVAWHGNYVPYKYALEKFINVGSISKDHIDPSIFCVLTAKSKTPGHPLVDFLIFSPRWDVASETYRPPYYHRNGSTEFMGLLYGAYGGRSDGFQPGGASYETGFCPHGVAYEEFKAASEMELKPMRISEGSIAFMIESSMMFTLTEYAMERTGKLHEHNPKMWDNLKGQFVNHLPQVNADLHALGLPPLTKD